MAIELGKVNVADLTENNYKILGIGINRNSNVGGVFAVNYTTLTQAKDSLTNLIMTRKGEREMNPTFGCDIWKILFEPIVEDNINSRIEAAILDAVSIWLPFIEIQQIIFDYDDASIDANKLFLDIKFSLVSNPSLTENLNITVKN